MCGELEAAFQREIPVIPVLVQAAAMPTAEDLPQPLSGLARRQAFELSDRRWDFDIAELISELERFRSRGPNEPAPVTEVSVGDTPVAAAEPASEEPTAASDQDGLDGDAPGPGAVQHRFEGLHPRRRRGTVATRGAGHRPRLAIGAIGVASVAALVVAFIVTAGRSGRPFREPGGVAVGPDNSLYVADTRNERVVRVLANGRVERFAGPRHANENNGDGGPALEAEFADPRAIAVAAGPTTAGEPPQAGVLYVADYYHATIRRIGPDGTITTVAGVRNAGFGGDGGRATEAALSVAGGVAATSDGTFYIADTGNNRIRKVESNGVITTVAGDGRPGYNGDGKLAVEASLNEPGGVAVTPNGTLYIADTGNNRIRKVENNGVITTVAGDGSPRFSGETEPKAASSFNHPTGLAVAGDGTVFVADTRNNRVRRIALNGVITTVAGNGKAAFDGDGGQPTRAALNAPQGVAVAFDGTVYVADTGNNRVRKIAGAVITTLA